MSTKEEVIRTRIWEEIPEEDNPFAATACYCAGYDVYGEVLGNATWSEYLYLLFKQERPTPDQARMLQDLAVALANPGPRDHSVRAAMNAGVGGSTYAACLIAALGVGAGQLGGGHEVSVCMNLWRLCGQDLNKWRDHIVNPPVEIVTDIWGKLEHPPGFDPHGLHCRKPVLQVLAHLKTLSHGTALRWLEENRLELESIANCPLSFSGIASAAFFDLGFSPKQGEMLYLLLRLPGAAVHALEQEEFGWRHYPFFNNGLKLEDDPGPRTKVEQSRSEEKTL
jgi:citrate synthase